MIRSVSVVVAAVIAVAVLVAGCGRDAMLRCENPEGYEDSTEHPPIRVPDDLSVPNQGDALQIPAPGQSSSEPRTSPGPCLESPPSFYEGLEEGAEGAQAPTG